LNIIVRYKHEISLIKHAKPNQEDGFVRCNREWNYIGFEIFPDFEVP